MMGWSNLNASSTQEEIQAEVRRLVDYIQELKRRIAGLVSDNEFTSAAHYCGSAREAQEALRRAKARAARKSVELRK